MAVLQDININVHGQPSEKRLQTFLRLSQNENGRLISFRVLGPPLPSGCTATFAGTKPDGTVYSTTGTVTGNFVVVQEDIQMTAVAGVWDAKLDIVNGTHNIMTALIRVTVERDVVDPDAIASDSQLQGLVAEAKYYAEHARTDAYGSPLTAPTKAQMTDHTRVYVYTGSEPNMVAGNWYLWNGSAWVSGGVYNAVAVQTDTTLSVAGKAADGKAAGDAIEELKEDFTDIDDRVEALEEGGAGISETAAQILIGILQKGMYTTDVSDDIDVLYELLTDEGEIVIPATSVTLSESTVTILDATKTVQLVATPVPSVTTDTPVWTSSDSTVATVSASGVVTGVANGNCVIRCTYGNVFAECSVYCTLGADLIYMLPTTFTGDGQTAIDTGWKMAGANDPDSGYNTDFTICYDVEITAIPSSDMSFISHINSGGKKYLWDLAGTVNGNTNIVSQTLAAQRASTAWTKTVPIRGKCVRTHTRQAREMSQYFYYVTGDTLTKVENFVESSAALLSNDITNTVILGGLQNNDGTIASYMDSSVTIHDFKIYNRVLSASEISEYLGKDVTA